MASSPLDQVPSTAVDAAGLSVSTAVQSPTDPRPGHIYDPTNLAAAVPIHFHPTTSPSMGGTNFIMLNSTRWTAATLATDDPGFFSDFTADTNPSWVVVNAATGIKTALKSGYTIPMKTVNDSRTLTAAVSRGNDYLWTLNSVAQGDNTVAVMQYWHNNPVLNTVTPLGEETIPAGTAGDDTVNFSSGIRLNATTAPYMYVYGTDTSGKVYSARKAWSRVGIIGTATHPLDTQWEYYHNTGWGTDPTAIAPVQTASGALVSAGPLSFAHYGMQRAQSGMSRGLTGYDFVSVVVASSDTRTAQIYSSLGGRPWVATGAPIALGTQGSTYMGGTVQFQQAAGPNPTMINSTTSATAVPYVKSVLSVSGDDSSLVNTWGLLQVPRLS